MKIYFLYLLVTINSSNPYWALSGEYVGKTNCEVAGKKLTQHPALREGRQAYECLEK
jgi:hypothetical protein